MTLIKIISYLYLAFSLLFIYLGIEQILNGEPYWMSFAIAAVAGFMFFFRRKNLKKMEAYKKNKKNNSL